MIIGNIPMKNKKDNVIRIIKTKRFKMNYSKLLHSLFIVADLTKHSSLCIRIQPYFLSFDYGYLALGLDFNYRLQKIDHKGLDIILRLLFFEIEIECSDDRHIEDYEKTELLMYPNKIAKNKMKKDSKNLCLAIAELLLFDWNNDLAKTIFSITYQCGNIRINPNDTTKRKRTS